MKSARIYFVNCWGWHIGEDDRQVMFNLFRLSYCVQDFGTSTCWNWAITVLNFGLLLSITKPRQ